MYKVNLSVPQVELLLTELDGATEFDNFLDELSRAADDASNGATALMQLTVIGE